MRGEPTCKEIRKDHFGICSTLEISTSNYHEDGAAEHPGLELCFVLKNSLHHRRFRGRTWRLAPGHLMFFNSREVHVEECSKNPTVPLLRTVIIPARFINQVIEETGMDAEEILFDRCLLRPSRETWQKLSSLFDFSTALAISPVTFDSLVSELVVDLLTHVPHSQSEPIHRLSRTGHFPTHIARAKRVIRENLFSDEIDLATIARESGLSKFHFIRSFKKETGRSPIQYLNEMRIDHAKRLLRAPRGKISDIAAEVGFSDLSAFNKAFKRVAGVAPSAYKEQFFPR